MRTFLRTAAYAVLGATLLVTGPAAVVTPALAKKVVVKPGGPHRPHRPHHRPHRPHHHHHRGAGVAIGVATGLAIGAAASASHRNYCGRLAYSCNNGNLVACAEHDLNCL